MKLIIVSGLSGSGKTIALRALEDSGFYCIDNLPVGLLSTLAAQLQATKRRYFEHAAVGIDARNISEDFEQFPSALNEIKEQGMECEILFFTADDATLLNRFSETRRKHPLSGKNVPLAEAIKAERALLAPMAANADWVVDTSHTNVHQLRSLVRDRITSRPAKSMSLLFMSFGYKHGIPPDADYVFDARCLPNPHWEPQLAPYTGLDQPVIDFLEQQPLVAEMLVEIRNFLEHWIPIFEAENRSYMTVAIGCTGGYHRSVYLVQRLVQHFQSLRSDVIARHRELS